MGRQRKVYERQLDLMQKKKMWTKERRGQDTIDATQESIEQVKRILAELDAILAKHDPQHI